MAKNVVILMDGTGARLDRHITNVTKTLDLLPSEDESKQRIFYQPGVGTGQLTTRMVRQWFNRTFGYGVKENVLQAYRFLMDAYGPQDRLFLFGFSRGGYQAELLADMLWRVGLLYSHNIHLIEPLWDRYVNLANQAIQEKTAITRPIKVHFLGLYDSIETVGLLYSRKLVKAPGLPQVCYGFHALAIDEKRPAFTPSRWHMTPDTDHLTQVWFIGCHADIGGWHEETSLSDITLKWMLQQAQTHGLELDNGWQDRLHPNPQGRIHESYTGHWKLLGKLSGGPKRRHIREHADIHSSVKQRVNTDETYRPDLPQPTHFIDDKGY